MKCVKIAARLRGEQRCGDEKGEESKTGSSYSFRR